MSRWKKRIAQIKSRVPINDLLISLGYRVHTGGSGQEQQFPCDLHGNGQDNKPSARVYPTNNSWYCFACSKVRDAIETVKAKKGIDFKEAVVYLEGKYGLPEVPWDDDDQQARENPQPSIQSTIHQTFHKGRNFEDALKSVRSVLGWITQDRDLPMDTVLAFWEASDGLAWMVTQKQIPEEKGLQALAVLSDRIDNALRGPSDASLDPT